MNANYQYAREGGSAFLGFHYGRVMDPVDNVRHAIKAQWDWTIPVGRGQRYGTDMNPWVNGVVGGWQFSGATRMQSRMMDMGGVRLVGMTQDELEDLYEFRIIDDPANAGRKLVTMLPDDIILNTRRAFSTSATSPTGYGALGVPEGRYLAPANSENCIELAAGDCTPRTLLVRAPWFARVDIGMTKRFPVKGAMNVEVRVDVLNLFDNINFNPVANPGGGATIFQVGSAYTRHGQQLRSGRPARSVLVPVQLVRRAEKGPKGPKVRGSEGPQGSSDLWLLDPWTFGPLDLSGPISLSPSPVGSASGRLCLCPTSRTCAISLPSAISRQTAGYGISRTFTRTSSSDTPFSR